MTGTATGTGRFSGPVAPRPAPRETERLALDLTGFYEQARPPRSTEEPYEEPLMVQVASAGEAIVGWFSVAPREFPVTQFRPGAQRLSTWPKADPKAPGPQHAAFVVETRKRDGEDYALYWLTDGSIDPVWDPSQVARLVVESGGARQGLFRVDDSGAVKRIAISFDGTKPMDTFVAYAPGQARIPTEWFDRIGKDDRMRPHLRAEHLVPLSPAGMRRKLQRFCKDPVALDRLRRWAQSSGGIREKLSVDVIRELERAVAVPPGYELVTIDAVKGTMSAPHTIEGTFRSDTRTFFEWYRLAATENAVAYPKPKPTPPDIDLLAFLGFRNPEPRDAWEYTITPVAVSVGATFVIGIAPGVVRFRITKRKARMQLDASGLTWKRDDDGNPIAEPASILDDPSLVEELSRLLGPPFLEGFITTVSAGLNAALSGGSGHREMRFYHPDELELTDFAGKFAYTAIVGPKFSAGPVVAGQLFESVHATFVLKNGYRLTAVQTLGPAFSASILGMLRTSFWAEVIDGGFDGFLRGLLNLQAGFGHVALAQGVTWVSGDYHPQPSRQPSRPPDSSRSRVVKGSMRVLFDYDEHRPRERSSLALGDGRAVLEATLANYRIAFRGSDRVHLELECRASPEGTTLYNSVLAGARGDWTLQMILDAFNHSRGILIPNLGRWQSIVTNWGEQGDLSLKNPPDDPIEYAQWLPRNPGEILRWSDARRVDVIVNAALILQAMGGEPL